MTNKSSATFHFSILAFVLGVLFVACNKISPSSEQVTPSDQEDRSPFTGNPCSAPCWQNLMIGRSTERDVMATLLALKYIDQDTIRIHRMSMPGLNPRIYGPGAEITADCIVPREQCLTIDIVEDRLTGIEIIINYEMRVDQSINYLGDPDYINYQMMGAEDVTCEVQLIWKSKQLILASETFKGSLIEKNCGLVRDTGKISSNMIISEVRYLSPEAINFYLVSGSTSMKYSGTIPDK
jgi:hypothetical protein